MRTRTISYEEQLVMRKQDREHRAERQRLERAVVEAAKAWRDSGEWVENRATIKLITAADALIEFEAGGAT